LYTEKEIEAMPRYLIEVPHEEEIVACAKVIKVFLETGSHFLTNAEWGCEDGEHKAWIMVDADNRNDARAVVPHAFRSEAKVTQLTTFTLDQIEDIIRRHDK